jgi:SAM-dependent methyltransferase
MGTPRNFCASSIFYLKDSYNLAKFFLTQISVKLEAMRPSSQDLSRFYDSPLGQYVAKEVGTLLESRASLFSSQNVVGLGYSSPYRKVFDSCSCKFQLIMPASQGAEPGACLAHEEMLPLADYSCAATLLLHYLEFVSNVPAVLKEIWRVLVPGGSLLVLFPNVYGLWAHFDVTPFGMGKAFSESDLRTTLEEEGFKTEHCSSLLSVPYFSAESFLRKCFPTKTLSPEKVLPGIFAIQCVKAVHRPVLSRSFDSSEECLVAGLA